MKKTEKLDVDVRFLLANERTLLAWIRTALALIIGGLALTQLGNVSQQLSFSGIAAMVAGAVITAHGYKRYKNADAAIRKGKLPSAGNGPTMQVYGIIAFALALALFEAFRLT